MIQSQKNKFLVLRRKIKKSNILTAVLASILMVGLVASGCTAQDASLGWSGVAPYKDRIAFVSVQGELIIADAATGAISYRNALEPAASGGLGCAAPAPAVVVYGTPAVSNDKVYLAGSNGKVYMYDLESYLYQSAYLNPQKPSSIISGPALSEGQLFLATSDGTVYALEADTLKEEWQSAIGDKIWATPIVYNGMIYIGSFDKKVYAINTSDGSVEWTFTGATGAFVSRATIHEGVVYIGSLDRYLYAIDSMTGAQLWKTDAPAGNFFWASAVISGEAIYAPNLDGNVYVYNIRSGELITEISLGSSIVSDPVVVNGHPIVITDSGALYSIDPTTQEKTKLQDLKQRVISPLATSDNIIYVNSQENETVWAIEADTGGVLWSHSIAE